MKRWGIIIVIAALALTGCSSKAAAPAAESSSSATIVVPDVVGQQGDAAKAAIEAVGLKVDWSETVIIAGNWTVDSQSPAAGTNAIAGAKVLLTVSKPTETAAASEAPAAQPSAAASDQTSGGLTQGYADTACEAYGDANYPYGFKGHWLLGSLAAEIQGDQWFLKAEADVTNQYNAKASMTVECTVNGSDAAPNVVEFNVY